MKAVYINLDPYLAAFAAWLKGGKTGPKPTFNPLPLAVTIPLGETACIYLATDDEQPDPGDSAPDYGDYACEIQIDGGSLNVWSQFNDNISTEGALAYGVEPGLSSFSGFHYAPKPISGNKVVEVGCWYTPTDGDNIDFDRILIPVLVRRETASGPVDLVDFTPPASAIAAGTDLKGATFDGNKIVAAAGTGALSAPAGA